MLNVSNAFKTAIDSPSRYIKATINVYFDGDSSAPVIFNGDDIIDISSLEELHAESDVPIGSLSSNELTITLYNKNNRFLLTNTLSPYYDKMTPNVLVEVYYHLEVANGVFETVLFGKYRTTEWYANSGSVEAQVTCNDILLRKFNEDLPLIPMQQNVTIKRMFEILFTYIGMNSNDYAIDSTLTDVLPYGWLPNGKVKDALKALAVAGCCAVFVNKDSKIVVHDYFNIAPPVAIFDDDSQIIDIRTPQSYNSMYKTIKLSYAPVTVRGPVSLLKFDNITIPNGGVHLSGLEFSKGPVTRISSVKLGATPACSIGTIKFGMWGADLMLSNTGAEVTTSLEILGYVIEPGSVVYTYTNQLAPDIGDKSLDLDCVLIQSLDLASNLASKVSKFVGSSSAYLDLDTRGNPALELTDTLTINDATNGVLNTDILPIRIVTRYNGSIDGNVYGIRKSMLV